MVLAAEWALHPDELRADLQEVYGIDLDAAARGRHTAPHVAALVSQLPPDARLRVAGDADSLWTLENCLLAMLINALHMLMYGMADRKRRGNPPEAVGPSWMRGRRNSRTLEARVLSVDELMEILNKPRG